MSIRSRVAVASAAWVLSYSAVAGAQGAPPEPPPGPDTPPPPPPVEPTAPPGPPVPPPPPPVEQPPAPPAPPPPPPPGFGVEGTYQAPGYGPPPPTWMPVPPPPPPPVPRREPGVTKDGIPLAHRGGLGLDTAVFSAGNEQDGAAGGSLSVELGLPLAKRTFLDARLPMGFATAFVLGNPNLGIRHVLGREVWVSLGGALGLPVVNVRTQPFGAYQYPPIPNGLWNLHDYFPNIVPLEFNLGVEGHAGRYVILRGQVDPVLWIPYSRNDEPELVIQHAAELQVGHTLGGGLRLQGVAIPTGEDYGVNYPLLDRGGGDLYQLAVEPFLAAEGELLFARLGILMPLDEELGPPFDVSWGFRMKAGFHID